jgi:hypothetical protein
MSSSGCAVDHFSPRMIIDRNPDFYSALDNGEVRLTMLEDGRSDDDLGGVEARPSGGEDG